MSKRIHLPIVPLIQMSCSARTAASRGGSRLVHFPIYQSGLARAQQAMAHPSRATGGFINRPKRDALYQTPKSRRSIVPLIPSAAASVRSRQSSYRPPPSTLRSLPPRPAQVRQPPPTAAPPPRPPVRKLLPGPKAVNLQRWARALWDFLHCSSVMADTNQSEEQRRSWAALFEALSRIIPCRSCATNMRQDLDGPYKLDSDILRNSNYELPCWLYLYHNEISDFLHKPLMTVEEFEHEYGGSKLPLDTLRSLELRIRNIKTSRSI